MAFDVIRPGGDRKASDRADLRTKGFPQKTAGSAVTGEPFNKQEGYGPGDAASQQLFEPRCLLGFLYVEMALSSFPHMY